MWHKADISISTGILPTISRRRRRRRGTTLSAETCIPVISLLRERRETGVAIVRSRRTSSYSSAVSAEYPTETVSNGYDRSTGGIFRRTPSPR